MPALASLARAQQNEEKYKAQLKTRLAKFEEHSLHMLDRGAKMSHQDFN